MVAASAPTPARQGPRRMAATACCSSLPRSTPRRCSDRILGMMPAENAPAKSEARSTVERALGLALSHPGWTVALAAAAVYANTLTNAPVLDDGWVIFENPLIKSLAN